MANLDDEPKTFDILRMSREVDERHRRNSVLRVASGVLLVGLGLARGRVLGAALAMLGVNLLTKQLTGRSLVEHVRARTIDGRRQQTLASANRVGNGARDVVDEASWQSFPASDPPGYSGGVN